MKNQNGKVRKYLSKRVRDRERDSKREKDKEKNRNQWIQTKNQMDANFDKQSFLELVNQSVEILSHSVKMIESISVESNHAWTESGFKSSHPCKLSLYMRLKHNRFPFLFTQPSCALHWYLHSTNVYNVYKHHIGHTRMLHVHPRI